MAASDDIHGGMNDVSLKARLLRSLLKEYVPDEKHPFRNHGDLSHIVSTLKTHQLLSEQCPHSTSLKVIDSWKSTVDAWINRVMALASSNMPDKSWAGICLLGLTFQDCSAQRFLASYPDWLSKIFSFIQLPSDSHFVRVASCASLSDLFTRLGEFNNAKKDGTSQATKVVQALLKLLDEKASDVVWEEAVCLLCVLINTFPASVGRHYDNVEAAIVSKIMSENCGPSLLEKLGHLLALLPKSKGDDDSWSSMITRVLLSLNKQLNEIFQGLEEGSRRDEALKLLLLPGKEALPPLGGLKEVSNQALKRPEEFLVSRASVMLSCCCTMLASPYPVQVLVPVRPLIAIARRVLLVDGSLSGNYAFMSVMRHEFICSELPVLHRHSLDLLIAVVKGLRSQLLPHVAYITQFLTEYLGACTLPELRIKLYSVVKVLLTSMGVGIAMYMTQEILKNAFMDLDPSGRESNGFAHFDAFSKGSQEEVAPPSKKKRKHSNTAGFVGEKSDQIDIEVERSHILTPTAVKIAALEVLEALLTVGGALRSNSWRPSVDSMLMTVASSACKGGWAREKNIAIGSSDPPIFAEFQLASLRALLASLLSFGHVRPPHLAQALDLFRRGSQNFGTKIAEYCNHALLALEVLIHPRALPLIDFQTAADHHYKAKMNLPSDNLYSNGLIKQHDTSFHGGSSGIRPNDVDDLYESWLGNGDETEETLVTDHGKTTINPQESFDNSNDNASLEKVTDDHGKTTINPREPFDNSNDNTSLEKVTDDILVKNDNMMIDCDAPDPKELITVESERMVLGNSSNGDMVVGGGAPGKVISAAESHVAVDTKVDDVIDVLLPSSGTDVVPRITDEDECASILDTMSATISNAAQKKGYTDEKGDESSAESLPDIVDGDPDSD